MGLVGDMKGDDPGLVWDCFKDKAEKANMLNGFGHMV